MRKFQILTHGNDYLSRAILRKLEELGYDVDSVLPFNCDHYYIGQRYNTIYAGAKDERCEDSYLFGPFITLDELFQMKAGPQETIKIGDSTYDKAEFEEATKNLKPIQ